MRSKPGTVVSIMATLLSAVVAVHAQDGTSSGTKIVSTELLRAFGTDYMYMRAAGDSWLAVVGPPGRDIVADIYWNGKKITRVELWPPKVAISSDGKRYAFVDLTSQGQLRICEGPDEKKGPSIRFPHRVEFSPDSQHLSYVAREAEGKWFVYIDHRKVSPRFTEPVVTHWIGNELLMMGKTDAGYVIVSDEKKPQVSTSPWALNIFDQDVGWAVVGTSKEGQFIMSSLGKFGPFERVVSRPEFQFEKQVEVLAIVEEQGKQFVFSSRTGKHGPWESIRSLIPTSVGWSCIVSKSDKEAVLTEDGSTEYHSKVYASYAAGDLLAYLAKNKKGEVAVYSRSRSMPVPGTGVDGWISRHPRYGITAQLRVKKGYMIWQEQNRSTATTFDQLYPMGYTKGGSMILNGLLDGQWDVWIGEKRAISDCYVGCWFETEQAGIPLLMTGIDSRNRQYVWVGEKRYGPFDTVYGGDLIWDPDHKRWAVPFKKGNQLFLMCDGVRSTGLDTVVHGPLLLDDGRVIMYGLKGKMLVRVVATDL